MSGSKDKMQTLPASEVRRLRKQASQLSDLQRAYNANQRLIAAERAQNDQLRRQQDQLINRIHSMDTAIHDLNTDLGRNRQETEQLRTQLTTQMQEQQRIVQEQAARFRQQLDAMRSGFSREITAVRQETANQIAENNRMIQNAMIQNTNMLRAEMQQVRTELNTRMNTMESQLETLESRLDARDGSDAALLEMAHEYYAAAQAVYQDTLGYHTFLLPHSMEAVQAALREANAAVALTEKFPTNASAARLAASQAFNAAMRARQDVITAHQEWILAQEAASELLQALESQLEVSRILTVAEDLEEPYPLDVDHWTNGMLSNVERRISALRARLADAERSHLTITQLEEIQNEAAELSAEMEYYTVYALSAFYASRDRHDIAAELQADLQFADLVNRQESYQGGDNRAAYRVRMRDDVTGNEVILTVTPSPDESGLVSNRVHCEVLNDRMIAGDAVTAAQCSLMQGIGSLMEDITESLSGVQISAADMTVPGFAERLSDSTSPDMNAWTTETAVIPQPEYHQRTTPQHANHGANHHRTGNQSV